VFPATPSRLRSVRGGSQTMHARPLISTRGRSVKHMGAKAPPDKRRIFSGGGPAVVHQGLLLQPNPLHPPGQPSASIRLRMQHRANAEPGSEAGGASGRSPECGAGHGWRTLKPCALAQLVPQPACCERSPGRGSGQVRIRRHGVEEEEREEAAQRKVPPKLTTFLQ
jgi:hypothetical protein